MRLLTTSRFTVDLATPADNVEICELFREVHIKGSALDLNQERDPDFFALSKLHHGVNETFVVRDKQGVASAICSAIVRDGWLDGEPIRTGYLCDLRIRPGFRGGVALAKLGALVTARLRDLYNVEISNTVIFDDNQAAKSVLLGRNARRRQQPVYRPISPFSMTSVQFTLGKPAPKRAITAATAEDHDDLKAFLTAQGSTRVLGEDFSGDLLERRLADWPGFQLEDFLIARENGEIIGCLAPWDTGEIKRTRVLGYYGQMRWIKRGFNLGARIFRYPKLPSPNTCFRFAFLTHLEVRDDDPEVLHDLLLAAYAVLRPRRLHFMSALVPQGSRLADGFSGFMTQSTHMTLYAVHLPDSPYADVPVASVRPGFEMALS